MFLVLLTYMKPLDEVDRHMKSHMAFLRRGYREKHFIASGRRVPRIGGVILARASSEEALQEIIAQDPFIREGVATFEIVQFNTSQYDPAFEPFADPA
jgi:uncharacterized protein YciI